MLKIIMAVGRAISRRNRELGLWQIIQPCFGVNFISWPSQTELSCWVTGPIAAVADSSRVVARWRSMQFAGQTIYWPINCLT